MTTQETAMSETMGAPENPAAFPMTGEGFGSHHYNTWQAGMTLRDYFAGQAVTAVAAFAMESIKSGSATKNMTEADIAKASYAVADALLAARSTK